MQKGNYLPVLLKCTQTVLSTKDIMLLWGETNVTAAQVRINYYKTKGHLYHIRKGLYAKDQNYSRIELASKILTPSYVSFETVLSKAGIVFQYDTRIFVASYTTREIIADGQLYSYKRIKDSILTNNNGMSREESYLIASPERAFLDTIYLNKEYYFDNLSPLDWGKVNSILPIYGHNRRMESEVKKYQEANFMDFRS